MNIEKLVVMVTEQLVNDGANLEQGWHKWRCFEPDYFPEPCGHTEEVARDVVTQILAELKAAGVLKTDGEN